MEILNMTIGGLPVSVLLVIVAIGYPIYSAWKQRRIGKAEQKLRKCLHDIIRTYEEGLSLGAPVDHGEYRRAREDLDRLDRGLPV